MNKESIAPRVCPLCNKVVPNEYVGNDSWYNFAWHVDRYHSKPYSVTKFCCVCGFSAYTGEGGVISLQRHLAGQDDLTEHLLVHNALRVMARIGDS